MGNGGWYGTREEWERLEAPLLRLDSKISDFAAGHGLTLSKNHKDWPERSLKWGESPRCLMQLHLADPDALTWHLWLCCSEDRDRERFWRHERLIDGETLSSFQHRFEELLERGFQRLEVWRAEPDQLEFATRIAAIP